MKKALGWPGVGADGSGVYRSLRNRVKLNASFGRCLRSFELARTDVRGPTVTKGNGKGKSTGAPGAVTHWSERLPRHVGIIMDGNGRWAKARHLPRLAGHRRGVERVNEVTEYACRMGLGALTLFAFSNENWKRPEEEVSGLMGLLRWYLRSERRKILDNNIRFRTIGDRKKLSLDILNQVERLEQDTSSHTGLQLTIALSYGSRAEIARAAARLAEDVAAGKIFAPDVDETMFESYLDTCALPALDMVIRTSGECRLSNFLLFQAAYAELFFDDLHWPDFSAQRFEEHLQAFASRHRRFGLTDEQVVGGALVSNDTFEKPLGLADLSLQRG